MPKYSDLPFIPPQASDAAANIDLLILGLTLMTVVFTVGIFVAILYFSVKYRRGQKVDRSRIMVHNLPIELLWTGLPILIAMGLFAWSTKLYLTAKAAPPGAMQIYVVGKQWMWKLQHPEGRWEMNELHVPVGQPVQLVLTSEDVIHSFFIPEFRLKQDVIPGEYTRLWFRATKVGTFHLFCAQFCGTLHSQMTGTVTVMEPQDYAAWLSAGSQGSSLAQDGHRLFIQHGCNGCHGPGSSVRAPQLEGIFNKPVAVQIPQPGIRLEDTPATTIIADQRYIHDSILLPEKEVVAGYKPIMPTFKNRISEEEVFRIAAYIQSLGGSPGSTERGGTGRVPDPNEYKARTGFIPENMSNIQRNAIQSTVDWNAPANTAGGGSRNAGGRGTGR